MKVKKTREEGKKKRELTNQVHLIILYYLVDSY